VKLLRNAGLYAATVVLCVAVLGGCKDATARKATAKAQADPLSITPTPEIAGRIETGTVQTQPVTAMLRVSGRVEADETRIARIGSPVTGRLTELAVYEGQPVKRGQTLATVYSTDLSNAQSAFLKALTQRQLAERAVSRARQLLDAGVIGEAELQRREAELQQVSADLSSSREQLAVLGLTKEAIDKLQSTRMLNSTTHIVSSIDGIVLERKATIGQVVQAVETLFIISDLSTVWLVADVPEQSAGALHIGKSVEAEIPALPGELITGRLSFVSSVVNRETRTVRTRMNLGNPERKFKPAMLATMTLVDGAESRRVVPTTAVVRENNNDHVFVQIAPNTFVLRRVLLGEEFRDLRVVLEGLPAGEKIVTKGAFHLNNERNRLLLQASEGA
jgi:membrane fusion protein, heavy metal efflux system